MRFYAAITAAGIGAILFLTIFFGSWYTIDQTERGVVLRNGALVGTAQPGLHFKLPIVDDVHKISIQPNVRRGGGFDQIQTYSRDQQPAVIRVSLNYQVNDPAQVYVNYIDENTALMREVDPKVYELLKTVFGQFNAVTAIQERARLNAEVETAVRDATMGLPITVLSVQIENIDFSDAYEASIEQRMLAEVAVQRTEQELRTATVQAQIERTRAEGVANATILAGNAEASAIRARGEALRDNPQLVSLVAAEKWNGVLPTTMVPAGAVPFLNVGAR